MVAVVLASGPSLTEADIQAVDSCYTIAVNSTMLHCKPKVGYAYDRSWWKVYYDQAKERGCIMYSACNATLPHLVKKVPKVAGVNLSKEGLVGSNSGLHGICLAYYLGFTDILLLGFDCQHDEGKAHHFGDHPKPLGNAQNPERWIAGFNYIAKSAGELGVRIINCSRQTALTCFEQMDLQEALDGYRNN